MFEHQKSPRQEQRFPTGAFKYFRQHATHVMCIGSRYIHVVSAFCFSPFSGTHQPFICPACSIQLLTPAVPPAVQNKTEEQATTYSPADHVRSTIGAGGLNFRVRHGTGWTPSAIITCSSALSSQRSCSASSFYLLPSSEQN